jgi:hypothetical protein
MDPGIEKWLAEKYPDLKPSEGSISGTLKFTAAYNEKTGRFVVIRPDREYGDTGLILGGTFDIRIEGGTDPSVSQLPALYVDGIAHDPDRHFNQPGFSACLCSPLEYGNYLLPDFDLRKFLEQLVIPFLYGQLFFDLHGRWPWPDYAHGATGLLEAYSRNNDPSKAAVCAKQLARDWDTWPSIKTALTQKERISRNMQCFCGKDNKIGQCHPDAWRGIKQLRRDVRHSRISLP